MYNMFCISNDRIASFPVRVPRIVLWYGWAINVRCAGFSISVLILHWIWLNKLKSHVVPSRTILQITTEQTITKEQQVSFRVVTSVCDAYKRFICFHEANKVFQDKERFGLSVMANSVIYMNHCVFSPALFSLVFGRCKWYLWQM